MLTGATLTQTILESQKRAAGASGDLTLVINDVVTACKAIASALRYGALADADVLGVSDDMNAQGEVQKRLDIIGNDLFLHYTKAGGHVSAVVSEEMEDIHQVAGSARGRYLLLCDPVDGSANIAENAAIGTVFSILRRPDGAVGPPKLAELLQPGAQQVCAGYAIYGPSTMIVLTTGAGVNGFTLDPRIGEFVLSHPQMRIPPHGGRFFINLARWRDWPDGVRDCVQSYLDGAVPFDFRWSSGVVADTHRIFLGGGMYLSPALPGAGGAVADGKLRLLYEVNPLSWLIEQAGGTASTGRGRALDLNPRELHQRSTLFMGSRRDVADFLRRSGSAPAAGSRSA